MHFTLPPPFSTRRGDAALAALVLQALGDAGGHTRHPEYLTELGIAASEIQRAMYGKGTFLR